MIFRQIFILIISALVLFFSYKYYKNDFCPGCCDATAMTSGLGTTALGPLLFNWGSDKSITRDGFEKLRADILSEKNNSEVIEITGHYFAEEENTTAYENLGLARAEEVGRLLLEKDPKIKIKTKAKLVDMIDGADSNEFESMSYVWISNEDSKKETVEIADTGDARILFPFNSSDKIDSPEVENYLIQVADRLNGDRDKKVKIVGHTDSLGEPGANRRLSERRAKKIRDILKSKGVKHSQIIPSGRGEADPVAPNTSESSRQLNRRVEITIK